MVEYVVHFFCRKITFVCVVCFFRRYLTRFISFEVGRSTFVLATEYMPGLVVSQAIFFFTSEIFKRGNRGKLDF